MLLMAITETVAKSPVHRYLKGIENAARQKYRAKGAKRSENRIMAARDVLTKNQLNVLEKLEAASGPLSAYTLLDQLRERGFRAPLQVYRALDSLVKSGFVHRLESLNSFVACAEPHDHTHSMTAFAICDTCGQVTEMSDHDVDHRLDEWVRSTGFAAKKAVIEFRGTCAKCLAEAA
jgi:Fur family zinc uptake transcriptional regulator